MRDYSKRNWHSRSNRNRTKALRNAAAQGFTEKFRSGLELQVGIWLKYNNIAYEFESDVIPWVSEPEDHKYTPDFKVTNKSGNVIYIETKGLMDPADRKKHLALKKQHPDLDIRIVFDKPNSWDRKAKTRSYGRWATENDIKWTSKTHFKHVIKEWINE